MGERMNNHKFFMSPKGKSQAYCSVCGKKILQDRYNMVNHGRECGFSEKDLFDILTEDSYCYDLVKEDDETLLFSVWQPRMIPSPGFKDKYEYGVWDNVFEARFRWNSREIEEKGLYNLRTWRYLISQEKVRYLGEEKPREVIARTFPVLPDIYSFDMFHHIYENRGYRVQAYTPSPQVVRDNTQARPGEVAAFLTAHPDVRQSQWLLFGNRVTDQGRKLLALRLYRYDRERRERTAQSFLVGEEVLWVSGKVSCREIMRTNVLCGISPEVLTAFDRDCPSFYLKKYLDGGGQNILLPFLCSENYHKGMELLIKGGFGYFADHFAPGEYSRTSVLFEKEPEPWMYSDIPGFLGISMHLLRTVPSQYLEQELARKRLEYVYHEKRSLIEGLPINDCVVRFLQDVDVTHSPLMPRNRIPGLTRLDDKDYRKILRYLSKLPDSEYDFYRDYLQMMYTTRIEQYGLCPRNLKEAHDDLLRTLQTQEEKETDLKFKAAVESYRYLETEETSEAEEPAKVTTEQVKMKAQETTRKTSQTTAQKTKEENSAAESDETESPYLIRCPRDVQDLFREGRAMHNCVASYRDSIIHGHTFILFLRKREDPATSFVTIEVQDERLVQVKAPYNQKASAEVQRFVCSWCHKHKIDWSGCYDISPGVKRMLTEERKENEDSYDE